MKTKDCFYGQVRAVSETENGTLNTFVPRALNVTQCEAFTWDNATGMNPLWNQTTVPTTYSSYGEMLKTAADSEYPYIRKYIKGRQTEKFYNERVAEDYNCYYSMLCLSMAPAWGIHKILSAPDALQFDFVTARQFDTWYNYPIESVNKSINFVFGEYTERVTKIHWKTYSKTMPLVYAMSQNHTEHFPIIGNIASCFLIFNREAVKILRDNFFKMILAEMDLLWNQVNGTLGGGNASSIQFLLGNPGSIFYKIFTKNNIHVIDIAIHNICNIKIGWSADCIDFSHLERQTDDQNKT